MANKIEYRITGKDDFTKSMKTVRSVMSSAQKQMQGVTNQIFSMRSAVVGLVGAVGGGMLAKSFVDAASTSEQLRTRLTSLLGSVEEGNRLFQDMSEYASQVPFQYEEIMASATQLSGVMAGGVDEVKQWMPLIGDLAAVSGLSIQTATEQVVRMYSAGAASADLFRERGITAMLGFQAGVSYSAEETRQMLMDAWDDPQSKFKDATLALASTWEGLMSMLGDKWFQFRNMLMDAGIFDFLKAVAVVLNDNLADGLQDSTKYATDFAQAFMSGAKGILMTIGYIQDAWVGWDILIAGTSLMWQELRLVVFQFEGFVRDVFSTMTNTGIDGVNMLISAYNTLSSVIGGDSIALLEQVDYGKPWRDAAFDQQDYVDNAKIALAEMANAEMPSDAMRTFVEEVEVEYEHLRNITATSANTMQEDFQNSMGQQAEVMARDLESRYERLNESLLTERELKSVAYAEDLALLVEALNNKLITEEQYAAQVEAVHKKHQDKQTKDASAFIKAKYKMNVAGWTAEQNAMGGAFGQMLGMGSQYSSKMFNMNKLAGYGQAIMSTYQGASKALEWGWPLGPIFAGTIIATGLAQALQIKGQSFSGQADAGMSYVPYAGTYMLNQGERVVQPEQNRDLTNFLANGGGGGRQVTIENINFNILPNATSVEGLLEMSELQWRELVAEKIIGALNTLYRQGVYPVYAEQES